MLRTRYVKLGYGDDTVISTQHQVIEQTEIVVNRLDLPEKTFVN